MANNVSHQIRGVISFLIYLFNTIFWSIPIFVFALLKAVIPMKSFNKFSNFLLNWCANNWVGTNGMTQRIFCNVRWQVYGIDQLKTDEWYLVVANHQTWVDILVLQNIFYRKIPFLKFFLKKELIWVPIIGQVWWALDFPFMKRYSRAFLKKNPHLKGKDLDITRKACAKFKTIPVSVMNFAEGTRFNKQKHDRQKSPYKNLLTPKAGGLAFVLGAMGTHLNSFLDVTIAYPEGPRSFWNFLCGRVTDIRVNVRSLPITPELLGDYFEDKEFRAAFQKWVNTLWEQKDRCIDDLLAIPEPGTDPLKQPAPLFLEPMPVLETTILPEKPFNAA
jgi:1-acyl-sn-glycerol-3-phosphate acyltransferase